MTTKGQGSLSRSMSPVKKRNFLVYQSPNQHFWDRRNNYVLSEVACTCNWYWTVNRMCRMQFWGFPEHANTILNWTICQHYSTFKPHLRLVRCPGTAASSCYSTGHRWLGRRLPLHGWLVLCLHQPPLPISNLNRHIFCRFCHHCLGWNRHETWQRLFYYSRKTGRHQHDVS